MDFFGYTLWTDLMMGHPDWISSLQLGNVDEFDPEGDFWTNIFHGLEQCLTGADLTPQMGGCLHISASIAKQTTDTKMFNIFPKYQEALTSFQRRFPFELGVHMNFGNLMNPLGKQYRSTFLEDLGIAKKIGATAMVVHPVENGSYNHEQIRKLFVDEVTSPELCTALRDSKIILTWENMIANQFSSLEQLLLFRGQLVDKLNETGNQDLIPQHRLCLDTGHLLIWKAHHYSQQLASQEIDRCLPEFAKQIKVFHIHANDGSRDFHITPRSTAFMDHPTRQGLDPIKFQACSAQVEDWLTICNQYATIPNRHIHLENDKVPFSYDQIIEWGKIYKKLSNKN